MSFADDLIDEDGGPELDAHFPNVERSEQYDDPMEEPGSEIMRRRVAQWMADREQRYDWHEKMEALLEIESTVPRQAS